MLSPSVEGRRTIIAAYRTAAPLCALVIGTCTGGAVVGTVSASLAWSIRRDSPLAVGILLGLGGLGVVGALVPSVRMLLPERSCQVPRGALNKYGVRTAALRWGVQLGLGMQSHIVTPAIYALVAVTLAGSTWENALVPWLVYGLARGAAIVGASLSIALAATNEDRVARLAIYKKTRGMVIATSVFALVTAFSEIGR